MYYLQKLYNKSDEKSSNLLNLPYNLILKIVNESFILYRDPENDIYPYFKYIKIFPIVLTNKYFKNYDFPKYKQEIYIEMLN